MVYGTVWEDGKGGKAYKVGRGGKAGGGSGKKARGVRGENGEKGKKLVEVLEERAINGAWRRSSGKKENGKMNEVLPRIGKTNGVRKVNRTPCSGIGHVVIPRIGKGISPRDVLRAGGVTRGGTVGMGRVEQPKREKKGEAEQKPPKVESVSARSEEPKAETGRGVGEEVREGMTEKEERLADLLEAAQEMKPQSDKTEGGGENIPEIPQPCEGRQGKKRRGRKRKNRGKCEGGFEGQLWQ